MVRTRVLLGNLEPMVRLGMIDVLQEDGIEVIGEEERPQALVLMAGRLQPDAVVLDLMLPGIDGWRVIDAPQLSSENNGELVAQSYFDSPLAGKDGQESSKGGGSSKSQGLMTELGKLDQETPGTPAALAQRINRDAVEMLRSPEIAQRLESLSLEAGAMSPADTAKFFAGETALWSKVIKEAGIEPQ